MDEVWKDIQGHEGRYQVSNLGRVRSLNMRVRCGHWIRPVEGRVLSQTLNTTGYFRVALGSHNRFKTMVVHRIIAKAFIPNPLNKPNINHKDGNKLNNSLDNLEWVTQQENNQHAQDTGLNRARFSLKQKAAVRKTARGNRTLPDSKVIEIKRMINATGWGGLRISKFVGVPKHKIDGIIYKGAYGNIYG